MLLLVLVFIGVASSLTACGSTEDKLLGLWKIKGAEYILFTDKEDKYHKGWKKCLLNNFNKMDNNLHKRIIIVSNDVNLIFKECSNLLIYNDGKIILNVNNKDLFDNREILLNNGFVLPDILKFIEVALDKKNIKLVPTNDIKELMKDVYRNV